jgi:signal transduction histidine kinase
MPEVTAPSRVVGIGASAGGLEAFSELLRHLPKNTGMAFVFVQHLEPKQTSRLTEILSRITEMPVEVAADGLRVKRNQVYVMPPGMDLTLLDGMLKLEPRTETAGRHLPIDYFLRSLAQEQGPKAIAVILSSMGNDGTAGLKMIKERGGATFAQDEPSAQHGAMPTAAVDSDYVDIVTTPRKIAAELGRLARDRSPRATKKRQIPESSMVQDLTDLRRLKQDVIDIADEEQRRFSRDLHDSHCQDLTAIAFFAETIAAALDSKDTESAGQIRVLGDMIRKSAENVHSLAAGLSSQQIEQSGLAAALKDLASRTGQRFGLVCTAKVDQKCRFRDTVLAVHLYRIA